MILGETLDWAKRDPRDVIAHAEYNEQMVRLRNFNRPFGEEKIRPDDYEQDYNPDDNELPF